MKIILSTLLLFLLSLSTFAGQTATVMGSYQDQSGENFVDFSVNDYTPKGIIDFTGRLANPDSEYHTGFMFEITLDQYKSIFESTAAVEMKLRGHQGDNDQLRAWSKGNTRQVLITSEVYNDKVFLAKKEFTISIVNGEIVKIKHLVERKKHVLILFSVPGTYTYIDLEMPVIKVKQGLGIYGDNQNWPLGSILSFANMERELAEAGTSNQYLE